MTIQSILELPRSDGAAQRIAELLYMAGMTPQVYKSAHSDIRTYLTAQSITFEGRSLPVSLQPNVIDTNTVRELEADLSRIRTCINTVIRQARDDIRAKRNSVLTQFFSHYSDWFDVIAAEHRAIPDIMLMRFDLGSDGVGAWKAMEPNSACPGGVIHCAHLRQAWSTTEIGKQIARSFKIEDNQIDDPTGFVRFMDRLCADRPCKNVAICNYNGIYNNELESLAKTSSKLFKAGETSGQILLGDVADVTVRDGVAYMRDMPLGLIYNKIDQLAINPSSTELQGWIAASQLKTCDFLNSFGALYLGEAKSVFAALCRQDIQDLLGFTAEDVDAIRRTVSYTTRIADLTEAQFADLSENRHHWVLKQDAATRGEGVVVGAQTSLATWKERLTKYSNENGVAQRAIDISKRISLKAEDDSCILEASTEFYGTDMFFFGDDPAGLVSRCHSSSVFNVGNGGQEVPTLVVSQDQHVQ
ncbi:hypothetical protein [uncultured Tateyamaria sp.]|uniref:hypothetical protein n=1 Tax=uncultured Tateyamaria sp. TaxID=455651 RepID=UPI0026113671|nr:hypothetical protein [uncultured Tateyamaria sp.]